MKKEKVIIFEGEHMFVAPKNTVYDKKTGMTHVIPEYANLVQPPNETVSPSNCFQIDPVTGVQVPTDCGGLGGGVTPPVSTIGGAAVDITTTTTAPPVDTTTPSTTTTIAPISIPINLGTAPTAIGSLVAGGGRGGGGGGASDGTAAKPKTFLQKYWWLLLVAAAGGYIYYKKRKK
jgi:hypothetical protein